MAHEIWREKFVDNTAPAWHRLGQVITEPLGAADAFERIGAYDVQTIPYPAIVMPDGTALETHQNALVRVGGGEQPIILGSVADSYRLVSPSEFCRLYDERVNRPIETMGVLKNGGMLFMTTKLPTFDVLGDEVENYLQAYNGMNGSTAIKVLTSGVRMVCANTVRYAEASASLSVSIPHDETAITYLGEWLGFLYERAVSNLSALQQASELLARARVTKKQAETIIAAAYPKRARPSDFGPKLIVERQQRTWERDERYYGQRRDVALDFFNGAGTGSDSLAAAGTAWGVVQAVIEVEDRAPGGDQIAEALLLGERGKCKDRAWLSAMKIATGKRSTAVV